MQDLQVGSSYGKHACFVREFSANSQQLTVQGVRNQLVPDEETKDRAAVQKLIKGHLGNPSLYGGAIVFAPKKR